jgi:hypothetical protein
MRGFGYFISIISVILLGIVAWPKSDDPDWHQPVVIIGMALSIGGMLFRWVDSRKQMHELNSLENERTPAQRGSPLVTSSPIGSGAAAPPRSSSIQSRNGRP